MLADIIQDGDIDFCALFDFFDLFFCFENAVVRDNVSLRLDLFHPLVKVNMAFFIFFAAAAPALVISARFFHVILSSFPIDSFP